MYGKHFTGQSTLALDETTGRLEKKPLKSTLTFVPPEQPALPMLDPRDDHLPQLVNEKVLQKYPSAGSAVPAKSLILVLHILQPNNELWSSLFNV